MLKPEEENTAVSLLPNAKSAVPRSIAYLFGNVSFNAMTHAADTAIILHNDHNNSSSLAERPVPGACNSSAKTRFDSLPTSLKELKTLFMTVKLNLAEDINRRWRVSKKTQKNYTAFNRKWSEYRKAVNKPDNVSQFDFQSFQNEVTAFIEKYRNFCKQCKTFKKISKDIEGLTFDQLDIRQNQLYKLRSELIEANNNEEENSIKKFEDLAVLDKNLNIAKTVLKVIEFITKCRNYLIEQYPTKNFSTSSFMATLPCYTEEIKYLAKDNGAILLALDTALGQEKLNVYIHAYQKRIHDKARCFFYNQKTADIKIFFAENIFNLLQSKDFKYLSVKSAKLAVLAIMECNQILEKIIHKKSLIVKSALNRIFENLLKEIDKYTVNSNLQN